MNRNLVCPVIRERNPVLRPGRRATQRIDLHFANNQTRVEAGGRRCNREQISRPHIALLIYIPLRVLSFPGRGPARRNGEDRAGGVFAVGGTAWSRPRDRSHPAGSSRQGASIAFRGDAARVGQTRHRTLARPVRNRDQIARQRCACWIELQPAAAADRAVPALRRRSSPAHHRRAVGRCARYPDRSLLFHRHIAQAALQISGRQWGEEAPGRGSGGEVARVKHHRRACDTVGRVLNFKDDARRGGKQFRTKSLQTVVRIDGIVGLQNPLHFAGTES